MAAYDDNNDLYILAGVDGGSTTQYGICPKEQAEHCWGYWQEHSEMVFSICEDVSRYIETLCMHSYDDSLMAIADDDYPGCFDHYEQNVYPVSVLQDIVEQGLDTNELVQSLQHSEEAGRDGDAQAVQEFVHSFKLSLAELLEMAGKNDVFIVYGP